MSDKQTFLASCLVVSMIAAPDALKADTNNANPDPAKVQEIANRWLSAS